MKRRPRKPDVAAPVKPSAVNPVAALFGLLATQQVARVREAEQALGGETVARAGERHWLARANACLLFVRTRKESCGRCDATRAPLARAVEHQNPPGLGSGRIRPSRGPRRRGAAASDRVRRALEPRVVALASPCRSRARRRQRFDLGSLDPARRDGDACRGAGPARETSAALAAHGMTDAAPAERMSDALQLGARWIFPPRHVRRLRRVRPASESRSEIPLARERKNPEFRADTPD